MRGLALLLVALLAACEEPREPVPLPEAGVRRDAGPQADANVARPIAPPTIDGTLDDRAWRDASSADNDVETNRPGSELRRLLALVQGERLYVAVDGSLAPGDRLLVYVDGAIGTAAGVSDFSTLRATEGTLDTALVQPLALPSDVRPDLAWGAAAMPHTAVGLDDLAGWRDIASDPARFTWIAAEIAPVACSVAACETSIALARLSGTRPRRIGIFARIVSADGELTNQTLPSDDPDRPEVVSTVLEVEDGTATPDGGVADGGVRLDAGPTEPVTVDGVIGATEWAGATVYSNSVSSAGTPFAGNALSTLRVRRTSSRLYVAIEGALSGANAILMYVDADVGGPDGLVLSTATINDGSGALDVALSKEIYLPAELRVDLAWGTLDLSRMASSGDLRMGWRDVATNPNTLRAIPGDRAPTACSASACETSIPLAELGARSTSTIGLFVRLGSASFDALSNQTLPADVPTAPELVNVFALVPP